MGWKTKEYCFDTFVPGDSSRLAYVVSREIAKDPGGLYNPLILTGAPGLGKTHLMKAIVSYVSEQHPEKKVRYVTSDVFVEEMIGAIQSGRRDAAGEGTDGMGLREFREKYRSVDVLLLDDVQFLVGKNTTQTELMALVDRLCMEHRQVVLSSDVPAEELDVIKKIMDERMELGFVAEIGAPDYETRMQILERKLERFGAEDTVYSAVKSCLPYIAEHVQENVRTLEGALNRLLVYCELFGAADGQEPPVEEILKDLIAEENQERKMEIPEPE